MDNPEMLDLPNSLGLLVDPTIAILAAQRLYQAPGEGVCHSGWHGETVPRRRAGELLRRADREAG